VCGLQNGTIDVRDLGEQQVKPVYRTRLEWFVGLGVFQWPRRGSPDWRSGDLTVAVPVVPRLTAFEPGHGRTSTSPFTSHT